LSWITAAFLVPVSSSSQLRVLKEGIVNDTSFQEFGVTSLKSSLWAYDRAIIGSLASTGLVFTSSLNTLGYFGSNLDHFNWNAKKYDVDLIGKYTVFPFRKGD
jgi:hypothetical protein